MGLPVTKTTLRPAATGDEQALALLNGIVHSLHVQFRPNDFKEPEPSTLAAWYRSVLDNQTTERTLAGVMSWADSLLVKDLHAALARATALSRDSVVDAEIARLRFLENEA
jgi:hypothetical protein